VREPRISTGLSIAAEEALRAFEGDGDISALREFAIRAYAQLSQYADLAGHKGIPLHKSELRGIARIFFAISESLNPRGETEIALKPKRRSGRPRLPLQELRRRSEAVSIVEEEVRTGTKKQSEAIRDAIAEMRKRGKGEGLSVRKLERALQRKRSAGDPPKPKI
jgi:hypothetical protein